MFAESQAVDFWRKSKAQGNLRLTGVQREPERTDSAESVRAKMLGAVNEYLDKFDSYGFFEKYDSSIITGPTGTNVLDVYLLEIA